MNFLNQLSWFFPKVKPTGPLSWNDLAQQPVGTRVKFTMLAVHPYVSTHENVAGEIDSNELNANASLILVKVDDPTIAAMLHHFSGCIRAYAPDSVALRDEPSPFSLEG